MARIDYGVFGVYDQDPHVFSGRVIVGFGCWV